jgi:hypothetical protein
MWGPDERSYFEMGRTLRAHGLRRGFRLLAERFLRDPAADEQPSPIRYGWALVAAAIGHQRRALSLASIALAPLALTWALWETGGGWQRTAVTLALAASSPLLWMLGRRSLQDAPVAVLALVALGLVLRGDAVGLGLTLAALLACKEAAGLYVPALALSWWLSGAAWLPFAGALTGAGVLWSAGAFAAYGRKALPVLLRALRGHGTDYTARYQSGAPHRLLVDLVLVSPFVVLLAAQQVGMVLLVAAIVIPHAAAPVRNVRNILAADLLMRAAAAVVLVALESIAASALGLLALIAYDAITAYRLRKIYDPVTAGLTRELGMSPHSD